jgi:ATP-dependent Clp protease ATP-binding subunit ClpA
VFERFTPQARSAVVAAQDEARRLHHPRIGTEHVLVALLVEPVGAGGRALRRLGVDLEAARGELAGGGFAPTTSFAPEEAEALQSIGIDLDEVRRSVEDAFGEGALERAERRWLARGHIPFSPNAKKCLELSLREALRLGDKHIGTEHIALALCRDADRSGAGRLLRALRVEGAGLRGEVEREIVIGGDRPGRTA